MTDRAEQATELRRTPEPPIGMGRSFADVWGAEPPAADPYAAITGEVEATPRPPSRGDGEATLMAAPRMPDTSANTRQTLSVKVSRPMPRGLATSGSDQTEDNNRLTVEIRREGDTFDPNRSPEQIVVTVSLNHVDEQVAITF
ncbi:MAG: hypothetical protein M3O34_13940 [Chloroflexota bacterium]|nr:hypothetical protein [Chloroflexota bacterium]